MTRTSITLVFFLLTVAFLPSEAVASRRWTSAFGTRGSKTRSVAVRRASTTCTNAAQNAVDFQETKPKSETTSSMSPDEKTPLQVASEQSVAHLAADFGCFAF